MDLEKTPRLLEWYARSYLSYVVGFFSSETEGDGKPASLGSGHLLKFSTLSAAIGYMFFKLSIEQGVNDENMKSAHDINYVDGIVVQFAYWIFLSIITFSILNFFRRGPSLVESISAILRIFPISFMIASYSAFIGYYIGQINGGPREGIQTAAVIFLVCNIVLIATFLPRSLRSINNTNRFRRFIVWIIATATGAAVAAVPLSEIDQKVSKSDFAEKYQKQIVENFAKTFATRAK